MCHRPIAPFRLLPVLGGVLLGLGSVPHASAQCGTPISAFPYLEGFEAAPAWTSGGTGNDWAWGTPAHATINVAGGGSKSWCVGGLTGAYYTNDERSWLESPCFDFSTLDHPWVSFKLFWEVERRFDGLVFQYSVDGGSTYANVGAFGDGDCLTAHWFNSNNITNLGPQVAVIHGWSGRRAPDSGSCLGGQGSLDWVIASHCLDFLAHAPSVRFRFFFGAGHQCNNYDGVAVDDIRIEEAPVAGAAFDLLCSDDAIDFTNTSPGCAGSLLWDFDDPASGAANTSAEDNPSHLFADPGVHTVRLTVTGPCGASAFVEHDVTVLDLDVETVDPTCGHANGSVTAVVDAAIGPVSYAWAPGGQNTAAVDGLGPGIYTVTASVPGSCPVSLSAELEDSSTPPGLEVVHTDVTCAGLADGAATAHVEGGALPYAFVWSGSADTDAAIAGLPADDYSCTVTDAAGCSVTEEFTITQPDPVTVVAGPDAGVCAGDAVTLTAEADGGTAPYSYAWSPEGPEVTPAFTSTYTVVATDANGCTSAADGTEVTVGTGVTPSFTSTEVRGCAPHCITFTASPADATAYHWLFGDGTEGTGATADHCYTEGGRFAITLTVTDAVGCPGSVHVPDYTDVLPSPRADFTRSPSVVSIDAPTVQFTDASTDATSRTWLFGDPPLGTSDAPSPTFTFPAVGCYAITLGVANVGGCTDTARASVCVEDPYLLFAPAAFTPDGDEVNEEFRVITSVAHPRAFDLTVFDRWGRVVFEASDPAQGWDGGEGVIGVYAWRLHLIDAFGIGHDHTGHVVLLR